MAATFPLLDVKELVGVLNDIGLDRVTVDDLNAPTPLKIMPIYAWFLDALGQLTLDDVMVTAQLQLDTYDQQDVYREVVFTGTLFAVLDQIMRWAALDDFSPVDIRSPTRERVRRVFSALVNFYLYEQDQYKVLEQLEENADQLAKLEHDHERRHVELQDAVQKKQAELDRRADEASKLEAANAASREELVQKKDKTGSMTRQIENDRREKARLQEEMEGLLRAVTDAENEIAKLRSRIVRSPERVRDNVRSLEARIANLKLSISEHERKAQDHKARIDVLRKYEGDITNLLKAVDEWEAELRRVEAEHDRLRRQTDERDARLEEANDLELRAKQLERRLETLNEQRDRQTTSAQEKRDTVRRRMERVENAHKALMREQAVADAEAGKRHKAITMKEKEIAELVKSAETEIARGEAAYIELKAEVESYSTKLERAIDSLNAFNAMS